MRDTARREGGKAIAASRPYSDVYALLAVFSTRLRRVLAHEPWPFLLVLETGVLKLDPCTWTQIGNI